MTTKEKIENYLGITIENNIDDFINAIKSYIEKETGRVFSKDTSDSERFFDGNGLDELYIDDFQEITTLKIDDTEITDYKIYPANSLPKTRIYLDKNIFTNGKQNISVMGKWGYGESPDDIVFASTVLVAGIVNSQNKPSGDVQSESIGRYSITYKTGSRFEKDLNLARQTLQKYKRYGY